jgi:hypothetical protein
MRYLIMVPGDDETEQGFQPQNAERDREMFAQMGKFNDELLKAGVMIAGDGLQPTSKGFKLTYGRGKQTVMDGPFAESKELIAGFWIIKVKSHDEAISWMKRAPFPEGVTLVARRLYEFDDFGDALTPELRAQEERQREQALANARKS